MKLEGANVLVTGAGGFVGAHVVRALLERDARVHATLLAEPPPSASLASWHRADLTDPQALRVAVAASAPDFVVHLAGQSSAGLSFELPVETFRVNAVGTWNLLEAVKRAAPSARGARRRQRRRPMARNRRAPTSARMRNSVPSVRTRCPRPRPTVFAEMAARDGLGRRPYALVRRTRVPARHLASSCRRGARQIAAIERGETAPVIRVGNLTVTARTSPTFVTSRAPTLCCSSAGVRGTAYNVCRGSGVRLDAVLERMSQLSSARFRIEPDPARLRSSDLPWLVGSPLAIERGHRLEGHDPARRHA
jgi:GDP-4-dehydro-6-deoxy-D-mannose reductase